MASQKSDVLFVVVIAAAIRDFGWRARLGGPLFFECIVFWFGGPALAGLLQVLFSGPPWRALLKFCSLDDCLLLLFRVGGPALAGLLL